MRPDTGASSTYFDTPARTERQQLLVHLLHNAGEVIYLRAPKGAGKTRFARRLLTGLGDATEVAFVSALSSDQIPRLIAEELGLPSDAADKWPNGVLAGIGGRELVLLIDDADQLNLSSLQHLAMMHAAGGHLLLLGQGGLAETQGDWDVRFVDLPPFDPAQSAAFIRAHGGAQASRINDEQVAAAHSVAGGLPGPLLEIVKNLASESGSAKPQPPIEEPQAGQHRRRPLWQWIAAGGFVLVAAGLLLFQDDFNEAVSKAPQHPATVLSEAPPGQMMPPAEEPPPVLPPPLVEAPVSSLPEVSLPKLDRDVPEPETSKAAFEAAVESLIGEPLEGAADPARQSAADPLDSVLKDMLGATDAPADTVTTAEVSSIPAVTENATESTADGVQAAIKDAVDQVVAADEAPATAAGANTGPAAVAKPVSSASVPLKPSAPEADSVPPVPAVPTVVASAPGGKPGAAPVEERAVSGGVAESRVSAVTPETTKPGTEALGDAWLRNRNPKHFTLQLVGARDRASVEKFAREKRVPGPYAIFSRSLKGSPWYSLVAGDYPSREAATRAKALLPKPLQASGAWLRTFDSIHKSQ